MCKTPLQSNSSNSKLDFTPRPKTPYIPKPRVESQRGVRDGSKQLLQSDGASVLEELQQQEARIESLQGILASTEIRRQRRRGVGGVSGKRRLVEGDGIGHAGCRRTHIPVQKDGMILKELKLKLTVG